MKKWCVVELLDGIKEKYMLTDRGELFSYSKLFEEKTFLGVIGNGNWRSYITMVEYRNELIFPPYLADKIAVYDLEKQEIQYIPLSLQNRKDTQTFNQYKKVIVWKEKAYFVGDSVATLICMNMRTYKIKVCSEWQVEFQNRFKVWTTSNVYSDVCVVGNCFWIPLKEKNYLMEYNMESDRYSFYHIGEGNIRYATVCFDGKYFWLSGDKKVICRWDKEKDQCVFFDNFPESFEINEDNGGRKELFSGSIYWNKNIYYSPMSANMSVWFNLKSGKIYSLKERGKKDLCMFMKKIENGKALYLEEMDSETSKCSKSYLIGRDNLCSEKIILFTEKEELQLQEKKVRSNKLLDEKNCNSLGRLINNMLLKRTENQIDNKYASVGNKIYCIEK